MRIVVILLTALMIFGLTGSFVSAQEDYGKHGFNKRNHSESHYGGKKRQDSGQHGQKWGGQNNKSKMQEKRHELKQKLNLTEEQKAKAKMIREQARPQIQPVVEKMDALKQEIKEKMQSGASKEDVQPQIDELKSLRKQANKIREENRQQFESILDADQRAEFLQFKDEMKSKKQEFKKHRKEKFRNFHENRKGE